MVNGICMHALKHTLIHMHSGPVCNGFWLEVCGSSSWKQQSQGKSEWAKVVEEGCMELTVLGSRDGRSWEDEGWWWRWWGEGLSLEPPLPETTSRPTHIQINTKPVGSREGWQIRRRQRERARLEDDFSATLSPIWDHGSGQEEQNRQWQIYNEPRLCPHI